jgi:putative ABC transport system permease protein
MMVISTSYSFNETIADVWRGLGFDALVVFHGSQRIEEMAPLLQQRPNVEQVEMWTWLTAQGRLPDEGRNGEDHRIALRGIPRDTEMFRPKLVGGRGLTPQDGHALVLNQKLAKEMGLSVGDEIVIDLPNGKTTTWTVVGLVIDITDNQETAYVHRDLLNRDMNILGRSYVAEIKAVDDSPAAQYALVEDMREHLKSLGVGVAYARTATEDRELAEGQFNILTTVLMTVTVLMAVVGSIGLSGTLSINVIERRREIGVMRAVGASSKDVALIFMGEGLLLGLVSWSAAVPLGLLAGKPFVRAIGDLIDFPGQYSLALHGLWIWLGIVVALSLFASWLPARRATQISVSQSLAYE